VDLRECGRVMERETLREKTQKARSRVDRHGVRNAVLWTGEIAFAVWLATAVP